MTEVTNEGTCMTAKQEIRAWSLLIAANMKGAVDTGSVMDITGHLKLADRMEKLITDCDPLPKW